MKDNYVAKNARKFNKAAVMKDRKKAMKRGEVKHKGKALNELDFKTYSSYQDKATADQLKSAKKQNKSDKERHTMRKRALGIARAQGRQLRTFKKGEIKEKRKVYENQDLLNIISVYNMARLNGNVQLASESLEKLDALVKNEAKQDINKLGFRSLKKNYLSK